MTSEPTRQYLVISAIGSDRAGIINKFSDMIAEIGGNVLDTHMTVMGGLFTIMIMVEGNWNVITRIEKQLPPLADKLGLSTQHRKADRIEPRAEGIPYLIEVVAIDHPGIIAELSGFFAQHHINIQELVTDTYHAPHTGSPMFTANITITVRPDQQIAQLREEFFDLCDSLNLDAVMEPKKS